VLSGKKKQNSVSVAPHSQAQCLLASRMLHVWTSWMHISLQEQVFSNISRSLTFQGGKTHSVDKQYFIAALWKSPSPTDRVFLGIYNVKTVHSLTGSWRQKEHLNLLQHAAPSRSVAYETQQTLAGMKLWNTTTWLYLINYHFVTFWRQPAQNSSRNFCLDIIYCNNSTIHIYYRFLRCESVNRFNQT